MDDPLARIFGFQEALMTRAVDRTIPLPCGVAFATPSLPQVWDLNFVHADRLAGISAEDLAAEAEGAQGALDHRRIVVHDEEEARRLEPGFREFGWTVTRLATMTAAGRPAPEPAVPVEDLPLEALHEVRAEFARTAPGGRSPEVVRQILEAGVRFARAGNARHFAVLEEGRAVAAADLYSDGRIAQIDDVATLETHRRRGYGTAVVLHALAAARAAGHDLVYLIADEDDWPKELYARLGFTTVGVTYTFTRMPRPG